MQTALVKLNNPQWLYLELKINIKNRNRLYFFDMHLGHGPSMAFMPFTYSFLQYSLDFSGLLATLLTILSRAESYVYPFQVTSYIVVV